jgi:uncharacterized protein (DUF1697 family)
MTYVALLRGINVGGQRKVDMGRLKETFERAGAERVRTYINSGNVIFDDDRDTQDLVPVLEQAIEGEFGFHVKVLLRSHEAITAVVEAIPDTWVNDKTERTDVWFLWEEFDSPDVIEGLTIKEGIDEVFYVDGAVVWRADGAQLTRSGRGRVIGSQLYKHLTSRNVNTLRKIHQLMAESSEG